MRGGGAHGETPDASFPSCLQQPRPAASERPFHRHNQSHGATGRHRMGPAGCWRVGRHRALLTASGLCREGKGSAPWWGNGWFIAQKERGEKKPTNPATNAPKALGKRIYILRNRASVPLQLTFPSHTLLPPARRCQSVPKNPAAPMQPAPKRRVPNPQPASAPPNQAGGTWCCPLVLGEGMLVERHPPQQGIGGF